MTSGLRLAIGLSFLALCGTRAAGLDPSVAAADLDLPHCMAYVDGREAGRAAAGAVQAALGLGASGESWTLPAQNGKVRHFTVGFTKPVAVGTVCAPGYPNAKLPLKPPEGRFISILKPDAPYPGDVTKEEHWTVLPGGAVKPLPPGTTTRQLRISEVLHQPPWGKTEWETTLAPVLCLADRYYAATDVGRVQTSQTSPVPELVWASWDQTQAVAAAVVFLASPDAVTLATLKTSSARPALEAPDADWEPRGTFSNRVVRAAFAPPVATRALRVTGPVFDHRRRVVVQSVCPLVPMGDRAEPPGAEMPPPYKVGYTMPMSGFVALDLHEKKSGKLVRRLVGETACDQGPVQEGWDLRDEDGQIVQPGDYTWKGIARPPFKLTYEMTAYNAGQPAWWAPPPGKGGGGWLGDHGAPNCVAAQGRRMWMGTACAESGHAFIATDLEGNKLWGTGSLSYGFRGPSRVAADNRCGYAMTDAVIARCDPERDFKLRTIYTFREQPELPWYALWGDVTTLGGFAARDGLLYCSVSAPSRWLKSSFLSDDLDPAKSQPLAYLYKGKGIRKGRHDKNYDFYEYDELMLFYAAFLTEKTPPQTPSLPDTAIPSTPAVSWGPAPNSGKLKGNLVAAFKKPVLVGSVLVPDSAVKVYALRPGVRFEDAVGTAEGDQTGMQDLGGKEVDLGDNEDFAELTGDSTVADWIALKTEAKPGRPTVALAPEGGVQTTALRYRTQRLPYTQVMGHRMSDVAPQAERVFSEGAATPQGGWRTVRKDRAVTEFVPAQFALVWPAERELRGLTLFNPPEAPGLGEVARLEVDAWAGPAAADPRTALATDAAWKLIGPYNVEGTPVVHQVDFGTTLKTRALRVRFLCGAAAENGGSTAGSDAIVAYAPAGADPTNLPVMLNERITVLKAPAPDDDQADATLVRHIPFPRPSNLAFDAAGTLYCLSDGQVVTVPLKDGETSRVVVTREKLESPVNLALDAAGQVYVTDNGPKLIKVFDGKTGALARTIGTAGGPKPGPWDPNRFSSPAAVAVDEEGKVWVADHTYVPKRIMSFTADGKPHKWFLGPTQYGGGGNMDTRDRRIVMYQGMKFVLDWEKRTWALDALLGLPVQRTVYFKDRRYIVGPAPGGGEVALIAYEREGAGVPVAALGRLGDWAALKSRADIRAQFGAMEPRQTLFVWSDLNGNGAEEAAEVQTTPTPPALSRASWLVGEDLAMVTEGFRLRPKEFTSAATPAPVYDLAKLETWQTHSRGPGARTNRPWEDENGRIFLVGTRLIDSDGQTVLWEYYNPFACHEGFYHSGYGYNRPPGKLNQEHFPIAHFRLGKEEYYVNNTDQGDWFCYTADGLLAGCLFGGPAGYGLRQWTMPEWDPGKTDLTDLRLGQEHYQGSVVVPDGTNLYAVAGHNHMSIVRIDGLEQLTRLNGEVTVTSADLEKTREWQVQRDALALARQEPKFAKMLRANKAPAINGTLEEWPEGLLVQIAKTVKLGLHNTEEFVDGEGALAFDENNLYVALRARDESPLRNSAQNLSLLFKSGDAAEVTLGLDPAADPKRTGPRAGDLRLLFAAVKGKPVAVLYKPVDPDAPADRHATFSSPVGQTSMDRVEVLADAKVAAQKAPYKDGMFWVLEAAVPWKSLGVEPPPVGAVLRADLGYLQSDENGVQTVGRKYWSGKSQTIICDIPSEARLAPALWGQVEVVKPDTALRFVASAASTLETSAENLLQKPADDTDVNELLGE